MRGSLACRDNVRPAISMRSPLQAPSFSLERINLPPFTYAMEAKKFEQRLPAARRYILERGLNEHRPGTEAHLGIVMQGGLWNTTVRGLHLLGLADLQGRTPVPLMILNAIHPLVPEELLSFLRGKKRVLVVEEGMPNHLERELKALAHEAKLDVEIGGKEFFSPHGEYVPALVVGGLRKFLVSANPTAQSVTAIEDRYAALTAHRETVRAALPEPVSKRPPSFCTGCPERPLFSAMKILRTQDPSIGDTHVAADIGCHTFSTQAPFHVGDRPARQPLHRHQRPQGADGHDHPAGAAVRRRVVDPHSGLLRHREDDRHAPRGADDAREGAQGHDRPGRVPARAPAPAAPT